MTAIIAAALALLMYLAPEQYGTAKAAKIVVDELPAEYAAAAVATCQYPATIHINPLYLQYGEPWYLPTLLAHEAYHIQTGCNTEVETAAYTAQLKVAIVEGAPFWYIAWTQSMIIYYHAVEMGR